MSDESWTVLARRGEYTAQAAAHNTAPMDWAVEGLLPSTGATVLFGTGSTGKTQLLLWLAAHIAARGKQKPKRWLGADVKTTGQVLVLSAEDLREHLFKRIGDIVWWMSAQTEWTDVEVEDVCSRIHVMPFLSMSTTEFDGHNPSLFERGDQGDWVPTQALLGIEKFLDEWNAKAIADGRPEDRFVGVILDSAVSMAGFEMSQSEATTNFLFYLNRMSRRQGMFWTIIGHTPKDAGKKLGDAAVERLRGSAMWSTTPRTVIELRCANPSDEVEQVLVNYPELETRDVLFLSTAKANSVGADLKPRVLIRVRNCGAFVDVTRQFPDIFKAAVKGRGSRERSEQRPPVDQDRTWLAIIDIVARVTKGGEPDTSFTRRNLRDEFEAQQPWNEALRFVLPEHEGKHSRTDHTLAWYLFQLQDFGAIKSTKGGRFKIIDLAGVRSRFQTTPAGNEPEWAEWEEVVEPTGSSGPHSEESPAGQQRDEDGETMLLPSS